MEHARKLEKAGLPGDQAKAVIEIVGDQVRIAVSSSMSEMAEKYRFADMATKGDLEALVEKYHLDEVATKSDIKDMATKADLEVLVAKYHLNEVATKSDFKDMVTKADLEILVAKYHLDEVATKSDLVVLKAYVTSEVASVKRILYFQFGFIALLATLGAGFLTNIL